MKKKIAYVIRNKQKNDTTKNVYDNDQWIIAVIYDYDKWPLRSLKHKGLDNIIFTREMTAIEENDFNKMNSTRCFFIRYSNVKGFLEDERACNVNGDFLQKIIKHLVSINLITDDNNYDQVAQG